VGQEFEYLKNLFLARPINGYFQQLFSIRKTQNKMVQHFVSFALLLSVTLVAMLSMNVCANPTISSLSYECTQASDCSPGECCVIGMMRYSMPMCLSMGKEGDYCRMNDQPKNVTLYYPNGASLDLTNAYTLFCPCETQFGLTCSQGVCQDLENMQFENTI